MAIFPISPEVTETFEEDAITERGINILYDFDREDFILKDGKFIEVVGNAGVAFWIEKTLRTEFESCEVYKNTEYGTKLKELQGNYLPRKVMENVIKDNIENSLLKHERIKSLDNFTVQKNNDEIFISFDVVLFELQSNIPSAGSEEGFTRISTLEEIKDFIEYIDYIPLITNDGFKFTTSTNKLVYVKE